MRTFHLSVLAVGYVLALTYLPSISVGLATHSYFTETYLGSIAASILLSVIALFCRPGLGLGLALGLRSYLLVILGYSIGGFLTAKLVLGIGLMVEICVLFEAPLNLAFSGLVLAILAFAQVHPYFLGDNALVDSPSIPRYDQLSAFCLVLALAALGSAWLGRLSARQRELRELIRIHEGNLETLSELNYNLQGYARTVDEESSERERNRISREIHDISGYILTNLIALLDAAGSMRRDDPTALTDILVTARAQAQEGLRETRSTLRRLRKEDYSMTDTTRVIYKIVAIFRKVAGIEVDLNFGNLPHALPHDLNMAIYRTVQEALTNAVRHGRATRVKVSFWVEGGELLLSISDNGKGAFEIVKGIGITGMEERFGALGGSIGVSSATGGGFSLSVKVPIVAPAKS